MKPDKRRSIRTQFVIRFAPLSLVLFANLACDQQKQDAAKAAKAAITAEAPPSVSAKPVEKLPSGCNAPGDKPVELSSSMGLVYGLRGDSTHLYYASWNLYNNRGDISKVRKDGEGATTLAALDLEPRGLALDEQNVYYTSGIRLMRIAKAGGIAATPAPMFSSQSIALDETNVYGIPGDYGPYDRVVKIATKGGDTTELATADRPLQSHGPFGYSSIAVDASGIYVTDSSGNRLLRFALAGGKPKVLTARQAKPYDLAIDGSHVFFSLAEQNNLMMVPKAGGTATKLASGLISRARFAIDETSIYTTFAGKDEQAPAQLARLPRGEGERKALAPVPTSHTVEAIAVDANCVFWLQRDSGSGKSVLYALKK